MLALIAVLLTVGLWLTIRTPRRAGRVWAHPAWAGPLRLLGLRTPADFLALPEEVIGGHRGRRVGRVAVGGRVFYLKREERVRLRTRLANWLAGAGWTSLSRREAKTLQALERAGLPGPRWAACGEDDAGRAFVLIEEAPGTPLPDHLRRHPADRRRVAAALGRLLARLHGAGFVHRDLYAKHVLVGDAGLTLLDWQRAGRSAKGTVRDLAALHATLPAELASGRDRVAFLRAYGDVRLAGRVEAEAGRMLAKRHVREKRGTVEGQHWTCLDGRALCVTPALGPVPGWLRLEQMPLPAGQATARRWLTLPDGRRVLLTRSRGQSAMAAAHLIWRLERHGVRGPRVLAAGERGRDSFLLVEPPDAVRLGAWLVNKPAGRRMAAWRQAAVLMRGLRDGCCAASPDALAVTPAGEVVLASVEGVRPTGERELVRAPSLRRTQEPQEAADVIPTLWRSRRRGFERPDWPDFAGPDWPDRIMDVEVTDRFNAKQGRSTGRWVMHAADGRRLVVYLKRHYRLGWWAGLLARLWPGGDWSPAMQEASHLEWARRQGVPVPAVVAAGEFLAPGGAFQSYLAVEELTGQMAVNEAIPVVKGRLTAEQFRRWKGGLAAEMARLSRLLHDRRHFHKDLYLCHFYVREEDLSSVPDDWKGRVSLIDLHRLAHHPWAWRVYQSKDLAQLLYSSEIDGVTLRDRVTFWRAYHGSAPAGKADPWLLWGVQLRWRRYRRHNLRHRPAGEPSSPLVAQEVGS
ncbi:MAG: lipopolysaccharide kinase InaA family protein [Gemmataceae bacterium]